MTGEEPAEASHTQAVQTQDPLTPSVGSVAVGGAANTHCKKGWVWCARGRYPFRRGMCCKGKCDFSAGLFCPRRSIIRAASRPARTV
ncbi:unnamed protein product [Polarella glacialis]|uniref:Uncharacterized protein n=1 Tax=Polarella glacialis TaxID=89957 RepID=A0A813G411_POLGL|nr:unnamed protein product [Polarella glacialis]